VYRELYWIATAITVASILLLELKVGARRLGASASKTTDILTFAKFLLLAAVILPLLPNTSFHRVSDQSLQDLARGGRGERGFVRQLCAAKRLVASEPGGTILGSAVGRGVFVHRDHGCAGASLAQTEGTAAAASPAASSWPRG
jgi:hypothetical protein